MNVGINCFLIKLILIFRSFILPNKIKILHIQDSDFKGGAQDLINGLFLRCDKKVFEFEVCFLRSLGKKYRERFEKIVKTHYITDSYISRHKLVIPPKFLNLNKYDILHTHLFKSFLWGNIWFNSLTSKYVIYSINHTIDQVPFYYYPLYNMLSRKNSYYFALNKTIERELLISKVPKEKISLQPIGIDEKQFSTDIEIDTNIYKIFNIKPDDKIILRVARLGKDKMHHLFIKSMVKIVREEPKAKLLIAGVGVLKEALTDLIKKLGLEKSVFLLGEGRKYLCSLNLISKFAFAMGWGTAMTENMACGLPIISFDCTGADQILINGENGFIIKKMGDVDSLAKKAVLLLKNEELCKEMGEKAIKTIKNKYTYSAVTKSYEDFYKKLLCV